MHATYLSPANFFISVHFLRAAIRFEAIARRKYAHPSDEPWQQFLTAVTNPDLHLVLALSLIGLLLTLNIMFRFPDLGAIIAQYNQF